MFKIVSKQSFNEDTFALSISNPAIAQNAGAGQYVDVYVNPDGEPLTLPIADFDVEAGTVTVAHRARTLAGERLGMLVEGDEVFQFRGPFGTACDEAAMGKAIFVAEGMGVASVFARMKAQQAKGCYTICVAGFASKDQMFWVDRLTSVADEFYVVTKDGTYGVSGDVIGPLRGICETQRDLDMVTCIGNLSIMKRGVKITQDNDIAYRVNFDAVTATDFGARVFDAPTEGKTVFDYALAPELDGHKVDFDKLLSRQRALRKQEEKAAEPSDAESEPAAC